MASDVIPRLMNCQPRHLINLADNLAKTYRDGMTLHQMGVSFTHKDNRAKIVAWILNNFSYDQINHVHEKLVASYQRGERYYVKGRPYGAKNKRYGDAADYDALADLPDDNRETLGDILKEAMGKITPEAENISSEGAKSPQMLDANKFALKTELHEIAKNISRALRDYCENGFANSLARDKQLELITEELREKINNLIDHRPTVIELKQDELPNIECGVQHKNFPLLLKAVNSRLRNRNHLNVWLPGPAGSGKTTAAEKLAEIFKLPFHYNGALATSFQVVGYNDANGRYVDTAFRRAWEHGGIYLFDEIDASMPDALLAINGALANSIASFPDKMVKRHEDCIIIAAANTTGMGGGTEYVGAMKQNAAFLNRFVYIPWPHDNALEDALCANKDWLNRVRYVRNRYTQQGLKGHLITMRATIFGEALLSTGISQTEVEEMCLKQGMTDAQWASIK